MSLSTPSLAARLRAETAPDHRSAEGGGFLSLLTDGTLGIAAYRDMLVQFLPVYAAIEELVSPHRSEPRFARLFDVALDRTPILTSDIEALGPSDESVLPATTAYVAHLRSVSESPVALLAHHYTRYLGDLSGGQFIGQAIASSTGLGDGPGMRWFDFSSLGDLRAYKDRYRSAIDALDLDESQTHLLIDETHGAYRANSAMLDELLARHRAA